ncbi:MFS-type transporter SLC18B1-like [Sycon ciliatum]|uniref:MFS-type transporter SLC18B1-like n=1 Tax=Sycon ciliatum TaxID=27933 RepID=UPI0031F62EF6
MTLAAIRPFFFSVALAKNPSGGVEYHTAIGGVLSVFALASLLAGPLVVYELPNMGSKQLIVLALVLLGSTSIVFSALNRISDWRVFLAYAYIIQVIQGCAYIAVSIPGVAYLTRMYPEHLGFVGSCTMSSLALGHTIGNFLSGGLYDIGGFMLPSALIGSITLLISLSVQCGVVDIDKLAAEQSSTPEKHVSTFTILRVPWICLLVICAVFTTIASSAVETSLSLYVMSEFHVGSVVPGAAVSLMFGFSTLFSPLVGFLMDRNVSGYVLLALGMALMCVGSFLVGPSAFMHMPKSLVLVFLSMIPLSIARLLMKITCPCLISKHLQDIGVGTVTETRVAVVGIVRMSFMSGFVVGPLAMSPLVAALGFPAAFTLLGLAYLALLGLLVTLTWGCRFALFLREVWTSFCSRQAINGRRNEADQDTELQKLTP